MNTEVAPVPLRHQLVTCAALCLVAAPIILLFHRKPSISPFVSGLSLLDQVLLGLAFGAAYWTASLLGQRFIATRSTTRHIAERYSRLDLTGLNPLWMALAAGFGEELLFRGALQPLLGVWVTSVIFLLLHVRAYRLYPLSKRVLYQSISIFAISVAFGYVAIYAGLVTVMLVHAAMDAVGLFVIRRMSRAPAADPA